MQLGSLSSIGRSIAKVFRPIVRHHAILFILFALLSIITAVYLTNSILSRPVDDDYRMTASEESVQTVFDRNTIERIEQLRESGEGGSLDLPPGRINPFTNEVN